MPQVPYLPTQNAIAEDETRLATRPWVQWFQWLAQLVRGDTNGAIIKWGTGSPETVVTAVVGSIFIRTDGGASTVLYLKETGTGKIGWRAV